MDLPAPSDPRLLIALLTAPEPGQLVARARTPEKPVSRLDQIAWLLFLIVLGATTVALLLFSSIEFLD